MDAALRRAVHPDPAQRQDALSEFVTELRRPLAERDPLRFWQAVSLILPGVVVWFLLAA